MFASKLTSINIPSSVTSIGTWAFYDATALKSITIPAAVTSIGSQAFYGTYIKSFYFLGNAPSSLYISDFPHLGSFSGLQSGAKAYVKSSATGFAVEGQTWNGLIVEDDSHIVTYNATSGTAVNQGSFTEGGAIQTAPVSTRPGYTLLGWSTSAAGSVVTFPYSPGVAAPITLYAIWRFDTEFKCSTGLAPAVGDDSATYTINNGVVTAGGDCSGAVVIPSGVTSIGGYAFWNSSLTSITIPEGVASIGEGAFLEANSLVKIVIPASVTSIGEGAFNSTTSLKTVFFLGDAPEGDSIFENLSANAIAYKSATASGFTEATWRGFNVQVGVFSVTFNSQGGSLVESLTLLTGMPLAKSPATPTRSGFVFAGWSETSTGVVIKYPWPSRYENKTLYAKWLQKANVTASKPTISGKAASTAKGTNKLTVKPGVWTGVPAPAFAYQWYLCTAQIKAMTPTIPKTCKLIAKQTKTVLPVVTAYKGKFLAVKVTGTSAGTTATSYMTASTAKVS